MKYLSLLAIFFIFSNQAMQPGDNAVVCLYEYTNDCPEFDEECEESLHAKCQFEDSYEPNDAERAFLERLHRMNSY